MAARKIDPVLLRQYCEAGMSLADIAAHFGVGLSAVTMARLRHRVSMPETRRRSEPAPTRWRCPRCGGERRATVLHVCRPAEPITRGLVTARQAHGGAA